MKRLICELNVDNQIYINESKSVEEAIKTAFKNKKYRFYFNSGLIDVNNRFRIFNYKGVNYIVKKSSNKDGTQEVELAKMAFNILNNTSIDGFVLKIIVPQLILIGNQTYIISEYKGNTLQEEYYSSNFNNDFTINNLFNFIKYFLKKGILYRGFLPRNTVIQGKNIYLLDWEDVVFNDNMNKNLVNKLWETNFLLNWSYFFPLAELKKRLKLYKSNNPDNTALIKYELLFSKWIGYSNKINKVRDIIMDTVLFAEMPLTDNKNKYCIAPNDMAHLVSDIFNTDLDILFDICCFVLRKRNENLYNHLLHVFSELVGYLYYNNINIAKYSSRMILVFFEAATKDIDGIDQYTDLINFNCCNNIALINNAINREKFIETLYNVVSKFVSSFNGSEKILVDKCQIQKLSDYILNLFGVV